MEMTGTQRIPINILIVTSRLLDHADIDEVHLECRSQLERAILWGFDISHLSTHLGALQNRPEFFDIYLNLAIEFQLPIRLESADTQATTGFQFRDLAQAEGIPTVDYYRIRRSQEVADIEKSVNNLKPGVTEISIEPSIDTSEIRAIDGRWSNRVEHLRLACTENLSNALTEAKGVLISWRNVRDALRHNIRKRN